MHEFLDQEESSLLAQLEQLDIEIRKAHEEILQRLLEETTRLGMLIGEVERTYQQPDWQLLKDIGTTLSRGQRETLSHSLQISPELENKFSGFTEKNPNIKEILEKFQDFLEFESHVTSEPNVCPTKPSYEMALLPPKIDLKSSAASFPSSNILVPPPEDAWRGPNQMTLDPETANASLYLSEDCKLVRWERYKQDLPSNPGRFKFHPCVLGSRGFTSGWHRWDVEVHREGSWALGVVKESIPRGHGLCLKPDEGVWALRHTHDGYEALTSPYATPLTLRRVPKRIRICLDYEKGRVVFFDAESKEQIFAFNRASFQGERVFPWFVVIGGAQLKLLP
ncbi:PREDICTED: tripartite motif-containing protein 15-like [Calidris pugnax]|uniref:tripartite motif-containing protein 15-like n=1 Tax=Calidris pugnax TaxID=198806 RepID=UPI00071CED01|nr:PREDICTED: tripartite motif-containing protein 15-like [Calidris pugnax]